MIQNILVVTTLLAAVAWLVRRMVRSISRNEPGCSSCPAASIPVTKRASSGA